MVVVHYIYIYIYIYMWHHSSVFCAYSFGGQVCPLALCV